MTALTDFMETELLNAIFRTQTTFLGATLTGKLANVYVGLGTAAPDEDGSPTNEMSGSAYARVAVATLNANWTAPADDGAGRQFIGNVNAITFPSPTGTWAITHVMFFDASTAGNMLMSAALDTPRTVLNGDVAPSFAAGVLVVKFA